MSKQSREAFMDQLKSGKYRTNQVKVFNALTNVAALNLDQLREHFSGKHHEKHMPHQSLTATLSSLCDLGVIAQNPTNGYFFRVPEHAWEECARRRDQQAYERWRARGEKEGWFKRAYTDKMVDDELKQWRLFQK
jgi:hypothetical protein